MQVSDIYTMTFLLSSMKGIEFTGNTLMDTLLIGLFSVIYMFGIVGKIKYYSQGFIKEIFEGNYNEYKIKASVEDVPINFKALLWYISNNKNNTIKCIEQFSNYSWDNNDNKVEKKCYIINQFGKFKINENIYGKMTRDHVEKFRGNATEYVEYYSLYLYSKSMDIDDIVNWVEDIVKEYKRYMKLKTIENQQLLSISYQNEIEVENSDFESSVTFENSYLPNFDEVINKIDFFLNNKEWYTKKGIPYNLGIMLYGEPGCGKTRFIKQLMNYTGRHGIDIKLNNKFCFNELKNIIHSEEITDEFIIPQDKRVIIFEDIDAMCDILKDRDLIEKEKNESINKKPPSPNLEGFMEINNSTDKKPSSKKNTSSSKLNNNNLSFFLNIIDGLNECSGRIIVMTTNKVDYLDKAIIRPGRIDIKIKFSKYKRKDVCGIINKFWDKNYTVNDIKEDVDKKYTSAEIINIFRTSECFDNIKDIFLV
jgi:hypothetical protein